MSKNNKNKNIKKIVREGLKDEDLEKLSSEEALELNYYENSVIIKVDKDDKLISDIATCFNIESTFEILMLAPLEFISRTDGIENEKEYKDKLWKQVRSFYMSARELLDKRYKL